MIAGEIVRTATFGHRDATVLGFWAHLVIVIFEGDARPCFRDKCSLVRTGRMAWRVEKVRRKQ
jgi:hypothetical protein